MIRSQLLLFLIAVFMAAASAQAAVNLGVQAPRSHAKAMKKWGELGPYLTKAVGQTVNIVPLHPSETEKAVASGKVDYMLSNPVLAMILQKKQGAKSLVTLKRKSGSKFSGVIFSKKSSGIESSSDLRGKFVLSYKFRKSAAAYVFQVKHLYDKGIDPHKDFSDFREVKSSQDVIVKAVDRGLVDAGFIKSGLLEEMAKEGRIKMEDFEIIDKVNDDFTHVHSTELYPEWTLTSMKSATADVSGKIRDALISLTPDHQVCQTAKISGFVKPESFASLESALKTLKLPPFAN